MDEHRRALQRERTKRYRGKNKDVTLEATEDVTLVNDVTLCNAEGVTLPQDVTLPCNAVTPCNDPWQHIKEVVQRKEPPETMPYLERLQRVAGSLGKNAGEVRYGVHGLTFEDIGNVIGILPPVIGKT